MSGRPSQSLYSDECEEIHMKGRTRFTAAYCSGGWLEISEDGNSDGWIATDTPAPNVE